MAEIFRLCLPLVSRLIPLVFRRDFLYCIYCKNGRGNLVECMRVANA